MRCELKVLWRDARRKGNGKPYRKATRWYGPDHNIPEDELPKLEICGGKIIATICAVDEPEWGSSYAKMDISYMCDACGGQHYNMLPHCEKELSTFVTRAIEQFELTEEKVS